MGRYGDLALTPETEQRLWTVKTWAHTYLVVKTMADRYDVHRIDGNGLEYVDGSPTQTGALKVIEGDLNS